MGKGKGMNSALSSADWSHGALPVPSEVIPLPQVYLAGSEQVWNDQIQIILRDVPKEWVHTVTVAETGWKIRVTWNPPDQGGPIALGRRFRHTVALDFALPEGWVSTHRGIVTPESTGCYLGYYDDSDPTGGYLINLPRDEEAECPTDGEPNFQAMTPCAWCHDGSW